MMARAIKKPDIAECGIFANIFHAPVAHINN